MHRSSRYASYLIYCIRMGLADLGLLKDLEQLEREIPYR
jgi:hypothetical protein